MPAPFSSASHEPSRSVAPAEWALSKEDGSRPYPILADRPVPVVREPAAVYDVETEPAVGWPWSDHLENVQYSIRIPEPSGQARCARCRVRFVAAGPTGYAQEVPICDMCLLEGSQELGMVMALTAVVRAFGAVRPASYEDYQEALAELGAFARIYERFAAKSGPARVFRIPGLGAESESGS